MTLKPGKYRVKREGHELIQYYKRKVVVSGDVVEVFTYPCMRSRGWTEIRSYDDMVRGYSDDEMQKERSEYSTLRAQQRMRNLVNANFGPGDKMLTLTFASSVMQYLDDTNPVFHSFIRKLKAYCAAMKNARPRGHPLIAWKNFIKLRYLAVVEWQNDVDNNGNRKEHGGNVHYHLILNIPYVDSDKIAELWGAGFIKIKRISDKKNVGAYFAKHGTKHDLQEDKKLRGRKKFFRSRGLMDPVEMYDEQEIDDYIQRHSMLQEFEKDVKIGDELIVQYKQYKLIL